MTEVALSPAFDEALEAGDWDRIEELWLEALGRKPIPTPELMEVRRRLWKDGRRASPEPCSSCWRKRPKNQATVKTPCRPCVSLSASLTSLETRSRAGCFKPLLLARAGQQSLDPVLEQYSLSENRKPLEVLQSMETWLDHDIGTIVEVHGQGVGRVTELNLELGNLKVDVGGRRPVSIPFGAVARFVSRLPKGHFLRLQGRGSRRRWQNRVAENPGPCLVHILEGLERTGRRGEDQGCSRAGYWRPPRGRRGGPRPAKTPRVLSTGTGSRLKYSVTDSVEDAVQSCSRTSRPRTPGPDSRLRKDLGTTRRRRGITSRSEFLLPVSRS